MYSRYLSRWGALALALAMLLVAPALASAGVLAYYGQNETLESGGLLGGQDLGAAYEQEFDLGPVEGLGAAQWAGSEGLHLRDIDPKDSSSGPSLQKVGGQNASGDALNATSHWWYFLTDYYKVLMPGTSKGPYSNYFSTALMLEPYLDSGYTAARSVLGRETKYYVNLWMTHDSSKSALGWYRPGLGWHSIFLNFASLRSLSECGQTVSHETNHLLLDNTTNLYNRFGLSSSWLFEALAYYTGNSVYKYGYKINYTRNRDLLKSYSNNGARKASWYESGARYFLSRSTDLDYVQLNTIGMFLASSQKGISAVRDTVTQLVNGANVDTAFARSYGGLTSGQYSIASGAGVNTLYSRYLKYYLGHY